MNSKLWLVSVVTFLINSPVFGFDMNSFRHEPPDFKLVGEAGQKLPIVISAQGLKRARILAVSGSGYRAYPMRRRGDEFFAQIKFEDLALLKYQFQLEDQAANFYESDFYTIRQPSNNEMETMITALKDQELSLRAKRQQLENQLFGVKQADPAQLAKRKSQELARALVLLGKKERWYEEIRSRAAQSQSDSQQKLGDTEKGARVNEARKFLQQDRAVDLKAGNN
ncbi:MAG: hypothetical protein KDD42_01070 [Bdellovibrionales bacterium]|nr:hypothetical protein [Bdellovibrionales bacterium]